MTQPVFEPTDQRHFGNLSWGERQLRRRPAPASDSVEMSWMAVYDDTYLGFPYSTASGTVNLQFPYIDWSDNALVADGGPFSYTTISGVASFGKTYAYVIGINLDGIYAITLAVASEDMNATKDYKIRAGLDMSAADYPGRKASEPILLAGQSVLNQDFSTGYFYYEQSWVLPVKVQSTLPNKFFPFFGIQLATTEVGNKSWTLRNRMWVTYLGPVHYAAASFPAENDPGPP